MLNLVQELVQESNSKNRLFIKTDLVNKAVNQTMQPLQVTDIKENWAVMDSNH